MRGPGAACTFMLRIRTAMGEEIRVDFNTGSGGGAGAGGSSGGVGGSPPGVSAGTAGGDFDYRNLGPSFVRTAREVLFNPTSFFRGIPRQGDYVNPLVFAVICALISAVLGAVIGFLINLIAGNGIGTAIGTLISTIVVTPIATAVGLFVIGAIYHLFVLLFARQTHSGYEATFRVVAYAAVLQLLSWLSFIPILGILVLLVVLVWNVIISVIGMREMHSTTTGKAAAIVLLPVVVVGILVTIIGVAIFAVVIAALSAGQ